MSQNPTWPLFGFRTRSHAFQPVLTVISARGATAVAELSAGYGLDVLASPGLLTRFLEKRGGAIDDFVRENHITELDRQSWDAKKVELGDGIY